MPKMSKYKMIETLHIYLKKTKRRYTDEGNYYRKEFIKCFIGEYNSAFAISTNLKEQYLHCLNEYIKTKDKYFLYMLGLAIELEILFKLDFSEDFECYMAAFGEV